MVFIFMKQNIFLFIWYILVFMCFLNSCPWESCLCFIKSSSFHFSVGHLLWKSVLGRAMQIPSPWQKVHPLDLLLGCQFPFFTCLIKVIFRRKYCIFYIIALLIFSHWRHSFDMIQIKVSELLSVLSSQDNLSIIWNWVCRRRNILQCLQIVELLIEKQ